MDFFLQNPTQRLRVRQIEREVQVPLPSAIKYAGELEKEGFLKSTTVADIRLYQSDRMSSSFLLEKRVFNLRRFYASGIREFLIDHYSNPTVVVFGSYALGEDTEESDVDIYVESPSNTLSNVKKFEEILQRKIQLFTSKKISFIKNKDLANNILNGITVNGFMEVFR